VSGFSEERDGFSVVGSPKFRANHDLSRASLSPRLAPFDSSGGSENEKQGIRKCESHPPGVLLLASDNSTVSSYFQSFGIQKRLDFAVFSVDSYRFCACSSSLLIRITDLVTIEATRREPTPPQGVPA
jgi:hypothetical protein